MCSSSFFVPEFYTFVAEMKTEGIKYAGSKLKLLPHIVNIVAKLNDVHTVLDGFSGSTRVSQVFAQMGFATHSNDLSSWSEVLATCYLKPSRPDAYFQEIINHLNALQPLDGWFSQHYGGDENDKKKPFQRKNTQKLDAIRIEIEKLDFPWAEKCVLLTSLMLALDKVDSTLGHYAAYLSKWSKRSYGDLKLQLPRRPELKQRNEVSRKDIFSVIGQKTFDLAYFDPPYGSNNEKMPPSRIRYAAYYHFWHTLIHNDQPEVFGKANRREDSRDTVASSVFEQYKKDEKGNFIALNALEELVKNTKSHYLLLSYSSGGRATAEQLEVIISRFGKLLEVHKIDYKKNVMSTMQSTKKWLNGNENHQEYLFLMEK